MDNPLNFESVIEGHPTVSSGSKKLCEGLAESIKSLEAESEVRRTKRNPFVVQYSCSRGMKLAEIVYSNADLKPDRKFRQYNMALEAKGGGQP